MANNKPKVVVLQGVPASGKSTYAKSLDPNKWIRINRDDIRRMMGGYMVSKRENIITEIESDMVKNALRDKWNVCIDDTNLNPKTINLWKEIAEAYNANIEFKEFLITMSEALERDKNREFPVGKKCIEGFFRKYYPEEYKKFYSDARKIDNTFDDSLHSVVLCDLDGTLALHQGRSPFEYDKIPTDKCDERLHRLLCALNVGVIFFSGREGTEVAKKNTRKWLDDNGFVSYDLYMREKGDWRPDDIVKKEMFEKYIKGKYNLIAVFDDRDKVVKMWRDLGILCCQVYYGDF